MLCCCSFDKMSKYDLPAMLNFVLQTTSQTSLYYVGHSQGTTIGFAEFSTNKELAGKVKKFFALAPVARIGHVETPMNLLGLTSASIKGTILKRLKIFHLINLCPYSVCK